MTKQLRLNTLLELLAEHGRLEVDHAAGELGVSAATIRRDLDILATQHLLTRTHGGAVPNATAYDLPLRYKTTRNAAEKQRIGRLAAGMVEPGAVVGSNGGTTTTEVARAIATRDELNSGAGVTMVTNALNIANELTIRPHVKVVITGGVARAQSYELIGPLATGVLEQITVDIAFLGVNAIDATSGACAHHEGEASITTLLASRARRVVVVADGSKLDTHAFARICPIDEVDVLITDASAPQGELDRIEQAGVHIAIA